MIAAGNPCAELKVTAASVTVGLTELNDVGLSEANLSLRGDGLTASFSGRIDCSTPADAALSGNASAKIDMLARLSLADCSVQNLVVDLHEIDSSLATGLAVASRFVEERLAASAADALTDLCADFRAQGPE